MNFLHLYDFAAPTPASRYLLFPTLAGVTVGAGTLLVSTVQGMPAHLISYNGLGWGLIAFGNTLLVSIYSIGNERAAFFDKQAEIEAHKEYPELPPYALEVDLPLEPVEPPSSKNGFITVAVKDEDTGTGADLFHPVWALWHMARNGGADAKSTSEKVWTGDGKPFSVDELRALRDWMIEQHIARWRNERAHDQGWELLPRARAIMRGLAKQEEFVTPLLSTGARK